MNLNEVKSLEKLATTMQERLNKCAQKYQGKNNQLENVQQLLQACTNLNLQIADVKDKCDFSIYKVESWINRLKEAQPDIVVSRFHFAFISATTFKVAVPLRILNTTARSSYDFFYQREFANQVIDIRQSLVNRFQEFKPHLGFSGMQRSWTRYPYNGQNNENFFIELNFRISNKIIEDLDGVMEGFVTQFTEFIEENKVR